MENLTISGVIERLGELAREAKCSRDRGGAVLAHDDIERIGRRKVLRKKCVVATVDASGPRRRNHRMLKLRADQLLEFGDELMTAFGWKIEPENFDGDESIAIGVVCTKNRSQSTIANLVKHAKRTEGVRRRGAGSFRVQSRLL